MCECVRVCVFCFFGVCFLPNWWWLSMTNGLLSAYNKYPTNYLLTSNLKLRVFFVFLFFFYF